MYIYSLVFIGWCLCLSHGSWELTKGPFPMLTSIPISASSPFASIAGRPPPGANCFIDLPSRQFKSARPHFPISLNHKIWDHRSHVNNINGPLLMTDDGMRHIRLFQVFDLFLGQFNGQSADGIFQMCNLRCPDDRRRHRLLL